MNQRLNRRRFLAGCGAAVASGALVAKSGAMLAQTTSNATPDYRTARELVAALAARQTSAVELVDQAIARIEALDPALNAVVVRDFERARAAAVAADAALARGERRPLLGLPMTVKEAFNVAGLPTTWGIPRFKDFRAKDDALLVTRLKEAGAIILGKTNVPINLSDWQSYNEIYGTTNNPWNPGVTPGGSSGGSAAALAAGYVALELGSDIGGSLRAPAHFCGVCSHKPSWALLPSRGHTPPMVPPSPRDDVDLSVVGPMARSVDDLALALDLLAGPDELVSTAYKLALPPPRYDDLKSFRVLVIDTHPLLPTAKAVRGALDRLVERLGKTGVRIGRAHPALPDLAEAARIYMRLLIPIFSVGLPDERYRQIEASAAQLPADDNSLDAVRLRAAVQSNRDWIRADRGRGRIQEQWRAVFKDWDVVLCPPMPTLAFPHDHSPELRTRHIDIDGVSRSYLDQMVWPSVATVAGLPSTTIPIEISEAGLPVGVQIVGPFLEDRTTLAFAAALEREFGGFTSRPRIDPTPRPSGRG